MDAGAKRNLVVMRTGNNSTHHYWKPHDGSNWDLICVPIESDPFVTIRNVQMYNHKWTGLFSFFEKNPVWENYDYIWCPDDDIITSPSDVDLFFRLCKSRLIDLASPTLTTDSFYCHPITVSNSRFRWRRTTFVEVMMPCFSAAFLRKARNTFCFSKSGLGFGMDFLWPYMLNFAGVYLFDEVKVVHSKPVGGARRADPAAVAQEQQAGGDARWLMEGFKVPWLCKTLGGCTVDGRVFHDTRYEFYAELLEGYHAVCMADADFATRLVQQELSPTAVQAAESTLKNIDFATAQVASGAIPISQGKPSKVSSASKWSFSQDVALEGAGGNDGLFNGCAGFHTDLELNPWWEVDLGSIHSISYMQLFNRIDCPHRCTHFDICVSDDERSWTTVFQKRDDTVFGGADGTPYRVDFASKIKARYFRVKLAGTDYLHLDQIQIFE